MIARAIGIALLAFVAYVVLYALFFAPIKKLPDVEELDESEDVEEFTNVVPKPITSPPDFDEFAKHLEREIARGLGIPYSILSRD